MEDPCRTTLTDPLIGKRLREYVILELVGKGGMAKVYKARHVLLNEIRAVKFLRPELRDRQECIARFYREAQVMVHLKSKHLVMLHEFGTVGNELLFLVMEYLEGETLRKRLRRASWLPVPEAVRIVQQVALGLSEAHKHGVVHRDISPDNILMVYENGEEIAKVIDFGIAKSFIAVGGKITQTMKLVGKAEYVAPEQICLPVGEDAKEAVDQPGRHVLSRRDVLRAAHRLQALRGQDVEGIPGEAPDGGPETALGDESPHPDFSRDRRSRPADAREEEARPPRIHG